MVVAEKYDLWRKRARVSIKYIIPALLISIIFEALSLFFTDNRMYGQDGAVKVMHTVNWFRTGVWFFLSLVVLRLRKKAGALVVSGIKKVNKRAVCYMVFGEVCLLLGGFFIMKFGEVSISRYHLIFLSCFSLFIIAEYYYFNKKIQRVETLFFITAMLVSVCYIFTAPVFVMGGDQGIHFGRTANLAKSYYGENFGSEQESYNEEGTNILIEKMDHVIAEADEGIVYPYTPSKPFRLPSLRYVAYILPAAVLAVADAVNMSPTAAYFAGQLCNALVYVFLIYMGARKLKSGKLMLIVFASLPRMLFLATRYSYTPWVVAWITFAGAYIIGEVQEADKHMDQKDMLVIAVSFLLGILVKAPYFMIIPLALLITRQKLPNSKEYKKYIFLMAAVMVILLMTLIIPVFTNEKGFDIYSDIRGGTNVNALGQLKFILTHPIEYTGILFINIYKLFSFSVFVVGKDGFTGIRAGTPGVLPIIVFLLFVWVIITDKKVSEKYWLLTKKRIFVFGLTFINICIICTVMYMNYNDVGATVINGCNPMYLMAFMFPFFYYCRSRHVQSDFNWRKYNTVVYGLLTVVMFITIYVRVVGLYV